MRVFGSVDPDLSAIEIYDALLKDRQDAELFLVADDFDAGKFAALNVFNWEHEYLGQVTRNACAQEYDPGFDELCTFKNIVVDSKSGASRDWLISWFFKTKVIYKFEMEHPVIFANNYAIVQSIMKTIRRLTTGISHMDDEGFTNENGDLIFWQLPDDSNYELTCAVLEDGVNWQRFTMNTSDLQAKLEFIEGKVPQNANRH